MVIRLPNRSRNVGLMLTLSLPNPSTHGMEKYSDVRSVFLSEIQKRMKKALIEANALVDKFIKNENEKNLDTK